jgi:hypothetical protein
MTGSASATILSPGANRLRDRDHDRPRGEPTPQAAAFQCLPSAERRQSDRQIARPFQERKRNRHVRRQPEGAAEQYICSLLNSNRVGYREGDGADRVEQALDQQHRRKIERSAGEAKRNPDLERTSNPAGEMKKKANPQAGSAPIGAAELGMNRGGTGGGPVGPAAPDCTSCACSSRSASR